MTDLRMHPFAFFGTPKEAADTLENLISQGFIPRVVICGPNRPKGRKLVMTPPPVKVIAEKYNLLVWQPETLKDPKFQELYPNLGLRLAVVVAYGKILPKDIIDAPRHGTLNVHYSLLPKWRGATPVEAAILHGDSETGVTIQQMQPKLDTGPILATERVTLTGTETTSQLKDALIPLGSKLLVEVLETINSLNPQDQDDNQATHCGKISKANGLINPFAQNPEEHVENWRKFRAYHSWPRVFYFTKQSDWNTVTNAEDPEADRKSVV